MKWTKNWLSLGGRYIMVQVVLSQFFVYWTHIYYLLEYTVEKINSIILHFIWFGSQNVKKIHLCRLDCLTILKYGGGLGLLNLHIFTNALLIKSLWRALKGNKVCSHIIGCKYIVGDLILSLYHGCTLFAKLTSQIWRSFIKSMPFLA